MQSSKIGFQKWAVAFHMMTTGIKGTGGMKLYREIGIRQATAWFLMQRIREGFMGGFDKPFPGSVEGPLHTSKQKRLNRARERREGYRCGRQGPREPTGKCGGCGAHGRRDNAQIRDRPDRADNNGPYGRIDGLQRSSSPA